MYPKYHQNAKKNQSSPFQPHVPSDTLRTWNMVPHPRGEMLSSMNSSNKQRNRKWEKTQKPKIRLLIYHVFHLFTKSRIWSHGRYAHSGIRVRPKTRTKYMFTKKGISLKKQQPKTQSRISHKSLDMVYIY